VTQPLVSIVLSTNRGGPYLAEALDSVAAQTYPHWELTLIDNGSPEPDAIDRIAGQRPGVRVIHQRDRGVSIARNVGIAASSGEFLAFLDDDDAWAPDRLERQVAALQAQPDAVACYSSLWYMAADGSRTGSGNHQAAESSADILSGRRTPSIITMTIRRDALDRVGGFDPSLAWAEDHDLTYRLAYEGPFAFVDAELVGYRRHDSNVTNDIRASVLGARRVIDKHLWAARDRGDQRTVAAMEANRGRLRWYAATRCGTAVLEAARERRFGQALATTAWAVRHCPAELVRFLAGRAAGRAGGRLTSARAAGRRAGPAR
jgi:glycosyltransferase involved in cell wall biosynthesis